jgi:hypothetical protein
VRCGAARLGQGYSLGGLAPGLHAASRLPALSVSGFVDSDRENGESAWAVPSFRASGDSP